VLLSGCDALQLGIETSTPPATPAAPASSTRPAPASPAVAATVTTAVTPPATAAASGTAIAASTVAPTTAPPTSVQATVVPGQPQVTEAILILNPGNSASVSSPVRVSGESDPTFEQSLVVQITDANGTVLATQPTTIQSAGAARGPFDAQVPFTISASGPGRISVFSTSPRDGGLVHLASVEVTLTTSGPLEPIVGQTHNETHIILEPAPQASLSGGAVHVSGFSDYVFESQLSLALCGEGGSGAPDRVCGTAGNVLATGSATLTAPDVGQPGPFAGDLTYHVSATVHGRLAVYSRSARDGGILHLTSVPVQIAP
jgi:hypothetical protein